MAAFSTMKEAAAKHLPLLLSILDRVVISQLFSPPFLHLSSFLSFRSMLQQLQLQFCVCRPLRPCVWSCRKSVSFCLKTDRAWIIRKNQKEGHTYFFPSLDISLTAQGRWRRRRRRGFPLWVVYVSVASISLKRSICSLFPLLTWLKPNIRGLPEFWVLTLLSHLFPLSAWRVRERRKGEREKEEANEKTTLEMITIIFVAAPTICYLLQKHFSEFTSQKTNANSNGSSSSRSPHMPSH